MSRLRLQTSICLHISELLWTATAVGQKKRGLPRKAGHRQGAKTFRTITRYCSDIGIKYLTVYAFSTENWKRPQEEVDALMSLFKSYLNEALEDFKDDSIVVKFIGDKSGFNDELRELMIENEESSKDRDGMVLNIAMNYGSRDEIVRAVRNISEDVRNGKISSDDITENLFQIIFIPQVSPIPTLLSDRAVNTEFQISFCGSQLTRNLL